MRNLRHGLVMGLISASFWGSAAPAQDGSRAPITLDAAGTIDVPAYRLPVSEYLSEEGQAYLASHLADVRKPELLVQRDGIPQLLLPYIDRQREMFPVERREILVGGVPAYEYLPAEGPSARNRDRVLINLHGGGFSGCWPACAELESMPIASLGRIRVLSLNYRQGPEHRFPAASEDVAAAYRELLESYAPENIGIYGCSAGGMLAGMAVAWFQTHELPRPGAIGVLCSGMTVASNGFGGDSAYTTIATGEGRRPPQPPAPDSPERAPFAYLEGVAHDNPLAAPASSASVLAQFPPTLIVTSTRGFDLSAAAYTHARLVKAGVDTDLHVFEGMFHGFFYNPDVPESRDCFEVIVGFFDRYLSPG